MTPRHCALLAFVCTFAIHLALVPAQGLTDDDDFYAPAALRYAEWVGDAITSPGTAWSRQAIDAAFDLNHEHPPFAKLVMGATHALFFTALGLYDSLDAARLGVSVLSALLAAALAFLLAAGLGVGVALTAPLLLLSLPRFLFHSQVATLDVPVAAMMVVCALAIWRAAGSRRWAFVAGGLFGLACLTKLNAPFVLVPFVAIELIRQRRAFRLRAGDIALPSVPTWLIACVVMGPLVFVALWPHLWFDTARRLGAYVAFHLNHYPIYLFYDGEIWEKPFAPWHAPFVLGLGSLPAPVLVLGLLGGGRAAMALRALWRGEAAASADAVAERLRALLLLQALVSIGLVAFSDVPKYGGEKLFMPFFPFFCALAADGARMVVQSASALNGRVAALPRVALWGLVVGAAAAPGAWGSVKHHGGYALSYYGESVGGLRGAVARGYERTYYDVADKPLARALDAMPEVRSVCFEPNAKEYVRTWRWLKRDGVIGPRIAPRKSCAGADVVVLTHERRWSTYPALREAQRSRPVLWQKAIDGVPLYTVYGTPTGSAPAAAPDGTEREQRHQP